ncbi:MAG: superoxide dismutase family protein [Planctomycetota bacterium]
MNLKTSSSLNTLSWAAATASVLLLAGCGNPADPAQTNNNSSPVTNLPDETGAVPNLLNETRGVVRITTTPQTNFPRPEGVLELSDKAGSLAISGSINGLVPGTEYGLFITTYGDLVNQSGQGLGGIFDPIPAADPEAGPIGLIGNRTASRNGNVPVYKEIPGLSIARGPAPVLGRAIVITTGPVNLDAPLGNINQIIGVGLIVLPQPDDAPAN